MSYYETPMNRGELQNLRERLGSGAYPHDSASGCRGIQTLRTGAANHDVNKANPEDYRRPNHAITRAYRRGKR